MTQPTRPVRPAPEGGPARPAARRSARRSFAAAVLVGESCTVLFGTLVAQGLAAVGGGAQTGPLAPGRTAVWIGGLVLAVLFGLAAGLLRSRVGEPVGWVLQAVLLATALVLPLMAVVGALFVAAWVVALVLGARIDRESAS